MPRAPVIKTDMRNQKIAQDRLKGLCYRDLAKKYDITPGRVSQILSQDDMKDVLECGTNKMVALIPLACNVHEDVMLKSDSERNKLKAAETVLKISGIVPSHTQNISIGKIMNIQNNMTIAPGVLELLSNVDDQEDDIVYEQV